MWLATWHLHLLLSIRVKVGGFPEFHWECVIKCAEIARRTTVVSLKFMAAILPSRKRVTRDLPFPLRY
jgi:hypothetical protein